MSDHPQENCQFAPSCLKDLGAMRAAVFGNGHPEKSLLVRMERVESRLAAIQKLSLATLCGVGSLLVKFIGTWLESLLHGS